MCDNVRLDYLNYKLQDLISESFHKIKFWSEIPTKRYNDAELYGTCIHCSETFGITNKWFGNTLEIRVVVANDPLRNSFNNQYGWTYISRKEILSAFGIYDKYMQALNVTSMNYTKYPCKKFRALL